MTQPKHTPGPWHSGGIPNRAPVIYTAAGNPVAVLSTGYGRENDQRAAVTNAALIAAAPELLAACRALAATARTFRNVPKDQQEWGPLDDEALEAAFRAIDKAEGTGNG